MRAVLLTLAIASSLPVSTRAAPVTLWFGGTVRDHSVLIANGWDSSVTVGTVFSGVVTFDDAALDVYADPSYGRYEFTDPWRLTLNIGNYAIHSISPGFIAGISNGAPDSFGFSSSELAVTGPGTAPVYHRSDLEILQFSVQDPSGGALASDELSAVPLEIAAWVTGQMLVIVPMTTGRTLYASGSVQWISAVAEPGIGGLVLASVLAALLRRQALRLR